VKEAGFMADVPVQLIVAAFQDETGADRALGELKEAKKEKLVNIKDAAILRKDAKGELHVSETGDMTGTKGGVIGGVVGAGLAVMTGGATLALTGLGALAGGLTAKLRDSGFKDERLRRLGESLKPGSSAIVAVIEHTWVAEAEEQFRKAGGEVVTEEIAADIAEQLNSGREVGYTAIADSEGAVAGRFVTDPASGVPVDSGAAGSAPSSTPPSALPGPSTGTQTGTPPDTSADIPTRQSA
jgi:uncharacterized membrane protein